MCYVIRSTHAEQMEIKKIAIEYLEADDPEAALVAFSFLGHKAPRAFLEICGEMLFMRQNFQGAEEAFALGESAKKMLSLGNSLFFTGKEDLAQHVFTHAFAMGLSTINQSMQN